jgi:hypothetical protein
VFDRASGFEGPKLGSAWDDPGQSELVTSAGLPTSPNRLRFFLPPWLVPEGAAVTAQFERRFEIGRY